MRVGKAVVDAIKTRGGENTNYTIGQASDIMCMYHMIEFDFYSQLWVWHSSKMLRKKPFHCLA